MADIASSAWIYHLIVFCIIVAFIILFNIIFVAKFQDSEEVGHAYLAKIVTVCGNKRSLLFFCTVY